LSRIIDLGPENNKLPDLIAEYDAALIGIEDIIALKGKNLEEANRENPAWLHYYDNKRVELKILVDHLNAQVKKVRGKLYKSYTENHRNELNDRAKDRYIDTEPAYLAAYGVLLEVQEIYEKYNTAVEAIKSRGYILNNITKIRVASIEDAEIY